MELVTNKMNEASIVSVQTQKARDIPSASINKRGSAKQRPSTTTRLRAIGDVPPITLHSQTRCKTAELRQRAIGNAISPCYDEELEEVENSLTSFTIPKGLETDKVLGICAWGDNEDSEILHRVLVTDRNGSGVSYDYGVTDSINTQDFDEPEAPQRLRSAAKSATGFPQKSNPLVTSAKEDGGIRTGKSQNYEVKSARYWHLPYNRGIAITDYGSSAGRLKNSMDTILRPPSAQKKNISPTPPGTMYFDKLYNIDDKPFTRVPVSQFDRSKSLGQKLDTIFQEYKPPSYLKSFPEMKASIPSCFSNDAERRLLPSKYIVCRKYVARDIRQAPQKVPTEYEARFNEKLWQLPKSKPSKGVKLSGPGNVVTTFPLLTFVNPANIAFNSSPVPSKSFLSRTDSNYSRSTYSDYLFGPRTALSGRSNESGR